jgi:hypothetical protein
MLKIFQKIPLIIYSILIVGISIYITRKIEIHLICINWLEQNDGGARVALYSSVLTVIGIFYGAIQLQFQRKNSLLANEYINQPEFEFYEFGSNELLEKYKSPKCCCKNQKICTNNCIDEHWFNIKQIGNLPATDIKISMFHSKDMNNVCCDKKVKKIDTLNKNAIFQYKLPPFSFNENLFDKKANDSFFVLISYKSLYSNLKYKRIYELEYTPIEGKHQFENGLWGKNIEFFAVTLLKITDYNSLKLMDVLVGSVIYFLHKAKIKDTYTIENWIIKY